MRSSVVRLFSSLRFDDVTGVPERWGILWQVIAIVLWTSAVAIATTGSLALFGW